MSDSGTHTQHQDGLVYAEAMFDDFDACVRVSKLLARGRCANREGGCGPVHAEKGPQPLANSERESPRWRPGFRHQGVGLSGRLRIESAPLRYYTREDARSEAPRQDSAHAARAGRAQAPEKALPGGLPARPRPGVYEPLGGEASEGFSTRSIIAQNIGCAESRRLYRNVYSSK